MISLKPAPYGWEVLDSLLFIIFKNINPLKGLELI